MFDCMTPRELHNLLSLKIDRNRLRRSMYGLGRDGECVFVSLPSGERVKVLCDTDMFFEVLEAHTKLASYKE